MCMFNIQIFNEASEYIVRIEFAVWKDFQDGIVRDTFLEKNIHLINAYYVFGSLCLRIVWCNRQNRFSKIMKSLKLNGIRILFKSFSKFSHIFIAALKHKSSK